MNDKLAELIQKNGKHLGALKDEKTLESIIAIKEIFLDKFLERGDIRLLILDSILEKPAHGYHIMASISKAEIQRSKICWSDNCQVSSFT